MVEHFEAFQNFSLRLKTANFSSLKWVANSASRKILHEITRTRTASKLSVLFAKKAYKLATCSNFTHIKELLQKEQGNLQSKVEDSMGNNNYKLGSDFFYDFLWQKREEYFGLSNKKSPKYPYSISQQQQRRRKTRGASRRSPASSVRQSPARMRTHHDGSV